MSEALDYVVKLQNWAKRLTGITPNSQGQHKQLSQLTIISIISD